jgi:hypothetical protein
MASGGLTDVARALNKRFSLDPPIDRRRVDSWVRRRTLNAAGQLPPSPAGRIPNAKPRTPSLVWDIEAWVRWYGQGVPQPYNRRGWKIPTSSGL